MRSEKFLLILLCLIIFFSVILTASKSAFDFLSVDKSSGSVTDTFTFNIAFATFPNSSAPFGLEYRSISSSTWLNFGTQAVISDFQRRGDSILDPIVPSDGGITQGGNYAVKAVYGLNDESTNFVLITLTSESQPPLQQQESERLNSFYILIAAVIFVALVLVFAFVSHLMRSPAETWMLI